MTQFYRNKARKGSGQPPGMSEIWWWANKKWEESRRGKAVGVPESRYG